jgi:hypothetical protein
VIVLTACTFEQDQRRAQEIRRLRPKHR